MVLHHLKILWAYMYTEAMSAYVQYLGTE